MRLKSDNKEIVINDKADEFIEKLFELLLSRYQIWFSFTWNRRFLQLPKYGRYCWCRLHEQKRVCKVFELNNSGEYHDLYVQGYTLLLADVYESFQNMFLGIYQLHLCSFLYCIWISMVRSLKKDWSKNRSLNWYWYVTNDRKRYQRRNMLHYLSSWKR